MYPEADELQCYLEDLPELQYNTEPIATLADSLFIPGDTDEQVVAQAFAYVRDEIPHSWDIQAHEVTRTALEVLSVGHGICYAKSNLLAALLRRKGIPTGFCYQRLLLFDEVAGQYCIHAMNAVYLKNYHRWLRIDARGNKVGVGAQFMPREEHLAFTTDLSGGEIDYPIIYVRPNIATMKTLKQATDATDMYLHALPERI